MSESDLDREITLCGADVHEALVVVPRECLGDREVGGVAKPGHRLEELLEPRGISIECHEKRLASALGLVLRLAGAERLRQPIPESEQSVVRHLE